MHLRLAYHFSLNHWALDKVELPLALTIEAQTADVVLASPGSTDVVLVAKGQVDPAGLRLSVSPDQPESEPELYVPERRALADFATGFARLLSFLLDSAIQLPRRPDAALLADSGQDEELLKDIAKYPIDHETIRTVHALVRPLQLSSLSTRHLEALLKKRAGLEIYNEALLIDRPVARFREFWRVLESGFGCQDKRLSRLLASYPPAVDFGFTDAELEELLILRHRASHAATRAGIEELRDVNLQALRKMDRLKCLVERVLVTKKEWGTRNIAVDELSPVAGYISAEPGAIVRLNPGKLRTTQ